MATVNLGRIALKWRGAFSTTETYYGQDIVNEGGTSYVAKSNIAAGTNLPSATPASWDVFAQGVEGVTTVANQLVYFDGTDLKPIPVGATNEILQIDTTGKPVWSTPTARQGVRAKSLVLGNPNMYRKGGCVMSDGSARWWGDGANWMHGAGNTVSDRSYPVRSAFPKGAYPIDRMWGEFQFKSVAITTDGKLWQWGQNNYGEIGRNSLTDTTVPFNSSDALDAATPPQPLNSIYGKTIVDYAPTTGATNYDSTLVLDSVGDVHSAGYNGYGQLGVGNTTNSSVFQKLTALSGITKIARGASLTTCSMALKHVTDSAGVVTNTLYSWGHNLSGEGGHNTLTNVLTPTAITFFNGKTVTDMGGGHKLSWAIDDAKNLYTWGLNTYGQLGLGDLVTRKVPVLSLADVVYCSTGSDIYMSTFAIKSDGSVWGTGRNDYGGLGIGSTTTGMNAWSECLKADGSGFTNAVKVRQGGTGSYNFTHILDADGVAWSCGYSGNGQLGRGSVTAINSLFDQVLIHRRSVVDIRIVGNTSTGGAIYLLDDGQVLQTGYGGESQLPEDDDESISVPMPVIF